MYAVGAVAVAVLYAKRRLAVTAMAPIGLTVVVVGAMAIFRVVAGPAPGSRSDDGRAAHPGPRRNARRGRVRRDPDDRRLAVRVSPRPAPGTARRSRAASASPLGMGGLPALDDRRAAPRRDHRRQHRRRRDARVPGRMGVLPRAVRRAGPTDPHRDPSRPLPAVGRRRALQPVTALGARRDGRAHRSRSPPRSSPSRCRSCVWRRSVKRPEPGESGCSPPDSHPSRSGCTRTAPSSCSRARTTRSATAGCRPSSRSSRRRVASQSWLPAARSRRDGRRWRSSASDTRRPTPSAHSSCGSGSRAAQVISSCPRRSGARSWPPSRSRSARGRWCRSSTRRGGWQPRSSWSDSSPSAASSTSSSFARSAVPRACTRRRPRARPPRARTAGGGARMRRDIGSAPAPRSPVRSPSRSAVPSEERRPHRRPTAGAPCAASWCSRCRTSPGPTSTPITRRTSSTS